jgi:hypothetical protein
VDCVITYNFYCDSDEEFEKKYSKRVSIRAQKTMLEGTRNVMIHVVIDIISPN